MDLHVIPTIIVSCEQVSVNTACFRRKGGGGGGGGGGWVKCNTGLKRDSEFIFCITAIKRRLIIQYTI